MSRAMGDDAYALDTFKWTTRTPRRNLIRFHAGSSREDTSFTSTMGRRNSSGTALHLSQTKRTITTKSRQRRFKTLSKFQANQKTPAHLPFPIPVLPTLQHGDSRGRPENPGTCDLSLLRWDGDLDLPGNRGPGDPASHPSKQRSLART